MAQVSKQSTGCVLVSFRDESRVAEHILQQLHLCLWRNFWIYVSRLCLEAANVSFWISVFVDVNRFVISARVSQFNAAYRWHVVVTLTPFNHKLMSDSRLNMSYCSIITDTTKLLLPIFQATIAKATRLQVTCTNLVPPMVLKDRHSTGPVTDWQKPCFCKYL